jgi:hypothetical protein
MRRAPHALLLVAALVQCGDDNLRPVLPPDVIVDTYAQQSAARVDVLWVVDNSGSMAEEQENLARNFQSFIELFTRGSVDYRIAVTTTDVFGDKGQFKGSPRILSPQTGNVITAFQNNIRVGISGSPFEAGMDAAEMALETQKTANVTKLEQIDGCKRQCGANATCIQGCTSQFPIDFLRPDAYLYLIFVSDEEDKSRQDVRYYWRAFETSKGIGNDGTVSAAAIVGTQPVNSCAANIGARYLALTELIGGEQGSICDLNFANTLRKLATSAVGLRRKFALSKAPNVRTIEVRLTYPCNTPGDVTAACASLDASRCEGAAPADMRLACTPRQGGPDGWVYEEATQVIFFAGESVPGLNANIELQYYPEGKP